MNFDEIYTDLIMEHSQNSPHKKEITHHTCSQHGHNPNCGDDITIYLDIKDGVIKDASFLGHGCAISQASTSIMIETLKNKTTEQAKKIIDIFIKMIDRQKLSKEEEKLLENALAFKNIKDMPARVKCALLAWKTTQQILEENKTTKGEQNENR